MAAMLAAKSSISASMRRKSTFIFRMVSGEKEPGARVPWLPRNPPGSPGHPGPPCWVLTSGGDELIVVLVEQRLHVAVEGADLAPQRSLTGQQLPQGALAAHLEGGNS